ncbi:XkdQ/YqbQ family protein [Lysinibacillus sp. 54212]|uniref:XkdQ/YqbQ family protein n=1 Tax=Lysinibacillus sp. 54212 TaxID=3119829 RepID=UPI002FCADEB9
MIDVRVAGYSLAEILTVAPTIDDQTEAVCRGLTLQIQNDKLLNTLLGKTVELWNNDKRLFFGSILKRGLDETGQASLTAYDPLFYFKNNPDDYYYKKNTVTANKVFEDLAKKTGVRIAKLANTKVVLPALWYQNGNPDEIAVDVLARTKQAGGKNYWFRFDPSVNNFGLYLFERVVPKEVWAFQVGVNLTKASYEESAEEIVTQVKLVNRETGKVVVRKHDTNYNLFGKLQHFEEVNKDEAAKMESKARDLLSKLSKIKVSSKIDGFNPGNMPIFYSGDVIYVEEKQTGIIGAYHIRNVTQEIYSSDYITVAMDIEKSASIPEIKYEDATTNPNKKK